jgi:hypothetical protein
VCIVRVETEVDRLLISVTTERALRRGVSAAGGREVHHFADTAEAVKEVEKFLRSHRPHGERLHDGEMAGDEARDAD